ncbi:hypothetical protein RQP46_006653 [Phenoliferia psychrophenolica]
MSTPHIEISSSGFAGVFGVEAFVEALIPDAPPPSHAFHITLLTKDEARSLISRGITPPFSSATPLSDLVPVGVAHAPGGATSVLVLFPSASKARKLASLPPKDFHITISTPAGTSTNDISHDLATLDVHPLASPTSSPRLLDTLALHHLLRGDLSEAFEVAQGTIERDSSSFKPFVRLGDAALRLERHKVAMLAFGQGFDLADEAESAVRRHCVSKIVQSSARTEWGVAMSKDELADLETLEAGVHEALLRPWSDELREAVLVKTEDGSGYIPPTLQIPSREPVYVPSAMPGRGFHKMQRFFRWIVPFHLAVSAEPRDEVDIDVLASIGIRHIITLTSERTLPPSWFRNKSISNTYLAVDDGYPPSVEQLEICLRLASTPESTPLLVHCAGGKGRAGTVVAAYLCAFGWARPQARDPWAYPSMGWRQSLESLRQIRPGSVETRSQEERLKAFAAHITRRGSVLPPSLPEPTAPFPTIEGTLPKSPDLIILVGLPGSGKSWFRNALAARDPDLAFVSGDEDGGTATVLTATSQHRRGKLLIDQCNPSVASRKTILDLAQHATSPVAVFFDSPSALCLSRAQQRTDHPTLPPGGRVIAAIKQFEKSLVPPRCSEGFAAVATVSSFPASLALVRRLAPPITLFKFPRTPHLINLGSATPDDIQRPLADFRNVKGLRPVICEKVDGANLAFSLDQDRKILVQNRSHYVGSGHHAQFRKLGAWVEQHREALDALLGADEAFPERVQYSHLPDLFLAFDLYDRQTRQFATRNDLEARLRNTSIHLPPLLHSGELLDEGALLRLIQQPSSFTADRMEGIYVKLEDEEKVVERGKIVRADFIAGNEHWSKGIISYNQVAKEHNS